MFTRIKNYGTTWLLVLFIAFAAIYPPTHQSASQASRAVLSGDGESGTARQPVQVAASAGDFPEITAESAIVISADTGAVLGAKAADEDHPMASTAKIMTALIAIERTQLPANDLRRRSLDDLVIVGYYPPRVPGSALTDINEVPLERGERLTLRDLLYGMMLVSGNNAAQSIAEHIVGRKSTNEAEGRDINDEFARMMNERAAAADLRENTHFLNPSGLPPDNVFGDNYSSARDLAKLARVAMRNSTFAAIVRARNWQFTSQVVRPIPGHLASKSYNLTHQLSGFYDSYPGATGVKPGGFTRNNGSIDIKVRVGSATFLGRTLIAVVMDVDGSSTPSDEIRKLLDYGFDVLFNLNRKDSSSRTGVISTPQITALSPDRVVTAVRDSGGSLKVTGWTVSALGAITHADTDIDNLTGRVSEIAIDTMGTDKVVTAVRDRNGRLKLIAWSVDDNGMVARLGDSGDLGQAGSKIALQPLSLSRSRAVTAMRNANGDLELITWEMDAGGSWTQLDSFTSSYTADQIGVTNYCRNCAPDIFDPPTYRVITGVKDNASNLKLISWDINANGNIAQHLESTAAAQCTSQIAINYQKAFDKDRIITAVQNSSGNLELATWRFNDGQIERLSDSGTQAGQTLSEIRMVGLATPGWLMTAMQTSSGNLKLISWRFARDGEITRFIASGSQAGFVSKIALCQLTGNTFVTAVKASDGTLKLISWKVE